MTRVGSLLAKWIPYVRIDLYEVNGIFISVSLHYFTGDATVNLSQKNGILNWDIVRVAF